MRHISFDESSVLREFAKIASDKGLIKTAEEVPQTKGPVAPAPAQTVSIPPIARPDVNTMTAEQAKLNELLKKYPYLAAVVGGKDVGNKRSALQQVYNQTGAFFKELKSLRLPGYANLAKPVLDAVKGYLGKKFPNQSQLIAERLQSDMQSDDGSMNAEDSIVTAAREDSGKFYDITGETGEDLVDMAHPGGGTKTELTHSKTDENLVETIVEQQEKDLDVAHSVPKGTYATLVDLYVNLHKMGHKSQLSGLKQLIRKVATLDEVVDYTLVRLADRLDNIGHRKAANKVDALLKKKDYVK